MACINLVGVIFLLRIKQLDYVARFGVDFGWTRGFCHQSGDRKRLTVFCSICSIVGCFKHLGAGACAWADVDVSSLYIILLGRYRRA